MPQWLLDVVHHTSVTGTFSSHSTVLSKEGGAKCAAVHKLKLFSGPASCLLVLHEFNIVVVLLVCMFRYMCARFLRVWIMCRPGTAKQRCKP